MRLESSLPIWPNCWEVLSLSICTFIVLLLSYSESLFSTIRRFKKRESLTRLFSILQIDSCDSIVGLCTLNRSRCTSHLAPLQSMYVSVLSHSLLSIILVFLTLFLAQLLLRSNSHRNPLNATLRTTHRSSRSRRPRILRSIVDQSESRLGNGVQRIRSIEWNR